MNITFLQTVLKFILIIGGSVILHELGHLVVSKIFRIKVYELGIGLPPYLCTLFHIGSTRVTLNALPLGGFISFLRTQGTPPPKVSIRKQHEEKLLEHINKWIEKTIRYWKQYFVYKVNRRDTLDQASVWKRTTVDLSGAAVNLVVGLTLCTIAFANGGAFLYDEHFVAKVIPRSPSEQAGISAGDVILRFNREKISKNSEFTEMIADNYKQNIQVEVMVQGDPDNIQHITIPAWEDNATVFGVRGLLLTFNTTTLSWSHAFASSLRLVFVEIPKIVFDVLRETKGLGMLVGIKSIYQMFAYFTNLIYPFSRNIAILIFAALTNISLGIGNLIPIPPLDGGRILLDIPEFFNLPIPAKFRTATLYVCYIIMIIIGISVTLIEFVPRI